MTFLQPPSYGSPPPAGQIVVHVPTLEAKDLEEVRLAVARAPGTAAGVKHARERILWGFAIVVALCVPVVAFGNRPDLTFVGVVLGFTGALMAVGVLRVKRRSDDAIERTYWFDAAGVRWRTPEMEATSPWMGAWIVEGERCLVIVKGSSLVLAIPKRLAQPDLTVRLRTLAAGGGATVDPKPLGNATLA